MRGAKRRCRREHAQWLQIRTTAALLFCYSDASRCAKALSAAASVGGGTIRSHFGEPVRKDVHHVNTHPWDTENPGQRALISSYKHKPYVCLQLIAARLRSPWSLSPRGKPVHIRVPRGCWRRPRGRIGRGARGLRPATAASAHEKKKHATDRHKQTRLAVVLVPATCDERFWTDVLPWPAPCPLGG